MATRHPPRRKQTLEFKPDTRSFNPLKRLYLTRQQRKRLLKWGLYAAVCVLLLVIQDVIMCHVSIFGGTTDLAVSAILLITVLEGSENGSIFVLAASLLYLFSGSSPGPYCVALLTCLGIGATLFRQAFWHRNVSSTVLCGGAAVMLYEMAVFVVGLLMRLTLLNRVGVFAVTGLLSWAVMLPLYPLFYAIGKIGGESWKE